MALTNFTDFLSYSFLVIVVVVLSSFLVIVIYRFKNGSKTPKLYIGHELSMLEDSFVLLVLYIDIPAFNGL